ncbi:MAG: orotidine-5'-phosphate decarboxylase [Acidimicrobiaceae bacterium]|nr:orotidine-5'-phosphate decarboxylase [Acidimicrobiaceae bacterium]
MHAGDLLAGSCESTGSVACVGLDPRPELIPDEIVRSAVAQTDDPRKQVAIAFETFMASILRAVAGHCAVVKPQAACYEAYGSVGWQVLERIVAEARRLGVPVILDAKRSDIGATAVHYRQGLLTSAPGLVDAQQLPGLGVDWITANPYLGGDSIEPLIGGPEEGKGVFVLVRTSNPGAEDFQDQVVGDGSLLKAVAAKVHEWGRGRQGASGFSDVGAVVGATWPAEAAELRAMLPKTLFLVPGFGAQGADASQAVAGCTDQGTGILVNSSRAILGAWQSATDADPVDAARAALDKMNQQLCAALP